MKKVSIIVPVYNIEKYLNKCVDSLINQTYKNIEILLIDDGSKDNSPSICDDYQNKDKRVKVIHKTNGGLSDARNYGIKSSTGDYLLFIDGDDYVEFNMVEDLVNTIEEHNVDMVVSKLTRDYDNGVVKPETLNNTSGLLSNIEFLKLSFLTNFYVCNKLYKKDIIIKYLFPVGEIYEDVLVVPKVILDCKKIYVLDKYHYHYIQRNDSIVHSKMNEKKAFNFYYHSKEIYNINVKGIEEEKEFYFMMVLSSIIYEFDKNINKEFYNNIYKELKTFKKKCIKNKYLSKSKKIMILLQIFGLSKISNFIKRSYRKIRYN